MTIDNIDEIFSDFIDHEEEQLAFLGYLQETLPGFGFSLLTDDGKSLGDTLSESSVTHIRELFSGLVKDPQQLVNVALPDKGHFCALPVEKINAGLVIHLPEAERDFSKFASGRKLLLACVDMAFMKLAEKELDAEKEQFVRQINSLKKQHGKLVEDNYRQYQLNQEKEKDYARKLEVEIARQTAELREANARLEEISRLKSDFLANMSHELRTPMNAIIGFTELLSETELNDEQADYTKTIGQSAASLLVLINDILDLAKIESGKLELEEEAFDLHDLLKNVVAMFRSTALEKNLKLSLTFDRKLPATAIGDSNRLRQILINLTGNALKFTTEGSVTLVVRQERQLVKGAAVYFAVEDTGIGIPSERIDAIFDKFTQADGSTTRKYGGTGLGLTISKQLIELMRGEFAVESIEGKGSVFSFTLPMEFESGRRFHVEEKPPEAEVAAEPPVDEENVVRVLLVEDNPVNQRLASILIKKQGCDVIVAGDGREALERLKEQECDLVFMDVQMPNMDGMEATRKIREIEASPAERNTFVGLRNREGPIFIIGLTAHAREEDEQACYEAGMDSFLTKPIVKDKLVALLQDAKQKNNRAKTETPTTKD